MTTYNASAAQLRATRWPDVFSIPSGLRAAISGRVAAAIFRHAVGRLPLQVVLPNGDQIGGANATTAPTITVHDEAAMMRRIGESGLIGFGESYLAGEWEADDLAAAIAVFAGGVDGLVPAPLRALRHAYLAAQPQGDHQTEQHSRHNVERHYDLSNDMFSTFLDGTMTYSSGLFADPANADSADLADAQRRKVDRILDQAGVGEGTRLLEVGSGWGELAVRAAQRGATVDSVTLSQEQLDYCRKKVAEAGVADRVQVTLQDYREVTGTYDAVVSVEMIEAVGLDFLPVYFAKLAECLSPSGTLVIQAITMPHHRVLETRNTYTWIHKYIFPGGALPSVRMLRDQAATAGLHITDDLPMGDSYAKTLQLWAEHFSAERDALESLGFDETFRRMWTFYLRYSEGGFRSGYLDVHQLTFTRPVTS
ncbi:SAM-dependent methyltransferase [Leekyejoonella antrihumi]|uniref:Class I SAM-dependent methyltransferase n=1 Tax=Leekyejoonella antrihumi TaxID=1660198 RepID=A0A563E2H2_9MICO|nr:cyclopropane-fatty-acyl-phospholipid synthase family protein [Leekyejoonella antrihumi]TWP36392.1 class I SAM-dependent methyltransferase [Leekyejoonella antrihumi]